MLRKTTTTAVASSSSSAPAGPSSSSSSRLRNPTNPKTSSQPTYAPPSNTTAPPRPATPPPADTARPVVKPGRRRFDISFLFVFLSLFFLAVLAHSPNHKESWGAWWPLFATLCVGFATLFWKGSDERWEFWVVF